jgi:predicted AAA+ superfamily ATPase
MILKSVIEECINEQRAGLTKYSSGQTRELLSKIRLSPEYINIISGIRRCGKSTLLLQLIEDLKNDFVYFNFEDPRIFGFELADFQRFEELNADKNYFFFDEIQNIDKWELFIRKLHDLKKIICITGSNSSLLSRELGTRLTGRNITKELFPFSYTEFCSYLNLNKNTESLDQFINLGGMPSYLSNTDPAYLQQLFKDILYRDIIVRYGIRNAKVVEEIALFLISNIAKEYSLNNIKKTFGLGSANSASDYLSWFEDSYLMFSLPRFSWSLKSISVNPKKIYVIDNGFARANSLSFSEDNGRLLENAVFLKLRRSYQEIFYFREQAECDFAVREKGKITQLIQVCSDLNSFNLSRELKGLKEAMDFFKMEEGIIVTRNQNDLFIEDGRKIKIISADQWL